MRKIKFKKGLNDINVKNKGIALKTIKEVKSMTMKKMKMKMHETKKPIICYECEKPGHIKSNVRNLKNKEKKFNKFKKRAYVSAIWGNNSSDEDEAEEEQSANLCLVAQEESDNEEICLRASNPNKWYIDSGCSRHMTGRPIQICFNQT
ncbi:hypothetical protein K1719_023078 [Acacia pycnantha]|nr:hypothetical protein K1719_023078 [Acacia pycnantha]